MDRQEMPTSTGRRACLSCLREFMSEDWLDVKADPTFRERLRRQLWEMIRTGRSDDEER